MPAKAIAWITSAKPHAQGVAPKSSARRVKTNPRKKNSSPKAASNHTKGRIVSKRGRLPGTSAKRLSCCVSPKTDTNTGDAKPMASASAIIIIGTQRSISRIGGGDFNPMFSSPAGRVRSQRIRTTTSRKFSQAVSTTGSGDHVSGIQAAFLATRIPAYARETTKNSTLDKVLRSLIVATRYVSAYTLYAISIFGPSWHINIYSCYRFKDYLRKARRMPGFLHSRSCQSIQGFSIRSCQSVQGFSI